MFYCVVVLRIESTITENNRVSQRFNKKFMNWKRRYRLRNHKSRNNTRSPLILVNLSEMKDALIRANLFRQWFCCRAVCVSAVTNTALKYRLWPSIYKCYYFYMIGFNKLNWWVLQFLFKSMWTRNKLDTKKK